MAGIRQYLVENPVVTVDTGEGVIAEVLNVKDTEFAPLITYRNENGQKSAIFWDDIKYGLPF